MFTIIFKAYGKIDRAYTDQILIILGIMASVHCFWEDYYNLIIWAKVDIAHVIDVEQFVSQRVPPFFQVTQSEHINIWHPSLVSYSAILGLVMLDSACVYGLYSEVMLIPL